MLRVHENSIKEAERAKKVKNWFAISFYCSWPKRGKNQKKICVAVVAFISAINQYMMSDEFFMRKAKRPNRFIDDGKRHEQISSWFYMRRCVMTFLLDDQLWILMSLSTRKKCAVAQRWLRDLVDLHDDRNDGNSLDSIIVNFRYAGT